MFFAPIIGTRKPPVAGCTLAAVQGGGGLHAAVQGGRRDRAVAGPLQAERGRCGTCSGSDGG